MKAAWVGRHRCVALGLVLAILMALSMPLAAAAPDEPMTTGQCASRPADSNNLQRMLTSLVDWLLPYPGSQRSADVDCLTSEDGGTASEEQRPSRLGIVPDRSVGDFPLNMNYTLSGLIQYEAPPVPAYADSDLQLRIAENISLLARHLDVTEELMRTVLQMSGAPSPNGALAGEGIPQELALQLGSTTLEAKADFMSGLTQYLVRSLMNADVPLPESGDDEVTLVFNMNNGVSGLDISTVLRQTQRDNGLPNPLNIGEITVKISNGSVTSQAELDPADDAVQIKRGKFAVDYHFGSNTLTSTTTFSRGEGVEEQRFQLTAQLGSVDFTGQALLFNNAGRQEFKLQAFWEGLTFSTLLTPQGFQESSFGLDLEF